MKTLVLAGLDAVLVEVYAKHEESALDALWLPGFPEAAARDVRVRVRSALAHAGAPLTGHWTITTDRPISDAAIVAAIRELRSLRVCPPSESTLYLGELSLTGSVHAQRGVLPLLLAAKSHGFTRAVVPAANMADCLFAPKELKLFTWQRITEDPAPYDRRHLPEQAARDPLSLADIRGNDTAKEALRAAAKDHRGLLFIGPPGAGKTMLARRAPGLLPKLGSEAKTTIASVASVAGLLSSAEVTRPFRAPHHTVSDAGLVGSKGRPGEVALAHEGVLFLDEVSEFRRSALGALRMVLAEGRFQSFPARPWVLCAANPCPCGYGKLLGNRCSCTPEQIASWRKRLRELTSGIVQEEVVLEAVPL